MLFVLFLICEFAIIKIATYEKVFMMISCLC